MMNCTKTWRENCVSERSVSVAFILYECSSYDSKEGKGRTPWPTWKDQPAAGVALALYGKSRRPCRRLSLLWWRGRLSCRSAENQLPVSSAGDPSRPRWQLVRKRRRRVWSVNFDKRGAQAKGMERWNGEMSSVCPVTVKLQYLCYNTIAFRVMDLCVEIMLLVNTFLCISCSRGEMTATY